MTLTPFETRISILAELWVDYRADEEFQDFIQYNDVGLPLAYLLDNDIVHATPIANNFIDETFDLLLAALGLEDTGFENLNSLFGE